MQTRRPCVILRSTRFRDLKCAAGVRMDDYLLIRKAGRRRLSLKIDEEGRAVVMAPLWVPKRTVDEFVASNARFIERRRESEKLVTREAERLGAYTEEDIKRLKKVAREKLSAAVPKFAEALGVKYNRITVRYQKTKWGSCSSAGNLNFNFLLADMPEEVLEAVAAHEVCHLKNMNHGAAFYRDLDKICPWHKSERKWLKEEGSVYHRRYGMYLSGGVRGE